MRRPVAGGKLLGDQTIRGRIVRNPQQRLGNAHERNALLIRQAELLQEGIEERPLVAPRARAFDQRDGPRHGAMTRASGELERVQQALHRLIFGPQRVLTRARRAGSPARWGTRTHSSWRPWRASSKKR